MTDTATPSTLHDSRLVRLLSELGVADGDLAQPHFAERLGRLIDLPGSIALAGVLGRLSAATGAADAATTPAPDVATTSAANAAAIGVARQALVDDFLRARAEIVQAIVDGFAAGSVARAGLPRADELAALDEVAARERYRQFYAARQKDVAGRVDRLRASVRAAVAGGSPRLAALAALDATFDETLAAPAQRLFGTLTGLLGRRFHQLWQDAAQASAGQASASRANDAGQPPVEPAAWLAPFIAEMQEALLAELDARLQPVLGLLAALDEKEEGHR